MTGIKQTLWVDDAPPAVVRANKEAMTCTDLTGFNPTVRGDLESYQRIVVVSRNGTSKLAHDTAEQLKEYVAEGTEVKISRPSEGGVESYRTTDDEMSLASRFLNEHRHVLRYVVDMERWLTWDGQIWRGLYDITGRGKAQATLQAFLAKIGREECAAIIKAAEKKGDQEKQSAQVKGRRAEARYRSSAMLSNVWRHVSVMVLGSSTVTLAQADLNRDPYLLNCPNGMVDLRTGKLRPHDPVELCTGMTRMPYDPEATATSFGWFLSEAQPSAENRHYLRRRAGMCLLGIQRTHVFLVDIGLEGRNGKGVLAGTERWVLGSYATTTDSSLVLVGRNERHPTTIASLAHRRFCWIDETRQQRSLDAARIKEFTGGAPRKAYFMKQDEFEYLPSDTMLLTTNYMPRFEGADKAFMARVQMLPWDVSFAGREDEELPERLRLEGEGVLAWMVRGAVEYLEKGLQPPVDVVQRTEEERREHDPIGTWLDEHLVQDADGRVQTRWLAGLYLTETGTRPPPDMDFTKSFGRALATWVRGKERDAGWRLSASEWREALSGKGKGYLGTRYESD